MSGGPGRVAVVGAGITGAAAAHHLVTSGRHLEVTLFDADDAVGGRIRSSPFAGVDAVDEGADAFLARVPDAVDLAHAVGLGDDLVHPERVGAAVWHDGLHDLPDGLVLGVPGSPLGLLRSRLLSWRGVVRAATEPVRPRSRTDHDSVGRFVRDRFGDEVHDRLVDALVGSIYATDTDRFSLAEVPQLAGLAEHRSLLLAARRIARTTAGTASAEAAPVFAAPRGGIADLVRRTVDASQAAGLTVHRGSEARVERGDGTAAWRVLDAPFDAVVLATPASAAADALADLTAPTSGVRGASDGPACDAADALRTAETADVVMLTMHVGGAEWPDRLTGRSGYLVPKTVQRSVTAASFASQKWAHWRPPDGGQILRVSLGRDGAPVLHLGDDELVERALDDLRRHLDASFTPAAVRVTRWPGAFAQYRPHHRAWVDDVRARLPRGIFLAGASYDGIGIPACVRSGRTIAQRAADHVAGLAS